MACILTKLTRKFSGILSYPKQFNYTQRLLGTTHNERELATRIQRLNFETIGTGPHSILLLPGSLGTIDTDFRPQMKHLDRKKFTIVAWDPLGYGKSRPPNRDFSQGVQLLYRDARIAQGLMEELRHDKFSVLGWSEGGRTGMILASLFPQSVKKLVVWGGSSFLTQDDIDRYLKVRDINSWSPKMKATMTEVYGEKCFRNLWETWVDTHVQILAQGGDICKKQLSKITCPTLILHGMKDTLVSLSHSQYNRQAIANSELYLFPDGKHNLHIRYYKEFNRLVEDFLTRPDESS